MDKLYELNERAKAYVQSELQSGLSLTRNLADSFDFSIGKISTFQNEEIPSAALLNFSEGGYFDRDVSLAYISEFICNLSQS